MERTVRATLMLGMSVWISRLRVTFMRPGMPPRRVTCSSVTAGMTRRMVLRRADACIVGAWSHEFIANLISGLG